MKKLNTQEVEYAVANHMNPRMNIIVPNIYWGMGLSYEADLWCMSPSGYITEIEIKISKQDIKAEQKKSIYAHKSKYVKRFYYAIPEYLAECEYLPVNCGLITVTTYLKCKIIRSARINKDAKKLTEEKKLKFLHLGCMRIWGLKESLIRKRRIK